MSKAPWKKGKFPDYTGFVIEVYVRKDLKTGAIQSFRCLQDDEDEKASDTLGPTGGMVEGGWALLMEAARTEVMLQLLYKLSNDPNLKRMLMNAEEAPSELPRELSESTLEIVSRALQGQVGNLVSEAIKTVSDGLRVGNG